jgi:two-component sensor histidine kinase
MPHVSRLTKFGDSGRGGAAPIIKRGLDGCRAIWSAGLPPRSAASLALALICVTIATLVRLGSGLVSPDSAVFAPYYASTLVAALVGGASAGLLASLSGGLIATLLFVPPDWNLHPFMVEQLVSILLFAASSIVIILSAESYRGLLQQLRDERAMRQLLNHELNHRIRNILASALAIINETLREQKEVRETVSARIASLAATNDILVQSGWRGASLREILINEFTPYGLFRFHLVGEDIECPSSIAVLLAMVIHELTTNALKYGALSDDAGRVDLAWLINDRALCLEWVERGGPKPVGLARQGFGTRLLASGLRQFDGSVEMMFNPEGLHARLSIKFPQQLRWNAVSMAQNNASHPGSSLKTVLPPSA